MKLRTKHLPQIGYFAQVKIGWFSGWQTIGKHNSGFGLYSDDHTEYPLETEHEAIGRCKMYEQHKVLEKGVATYAGV